MMKMSRGRLKSSSKSTKISNCYRELSGTFLYLIVIVACLLPRTLSDTTDDEFKYANAPVPSAIKRAGSFGPLQDEEFPQFDNVANKKAILALPSNYSYDPNFPPKSINIGPVTAVCMDNNENLAVLHRDDRIWDGSTFTYDNQFAHRDWGPIKVPTVLVLNRKTGRVLSNWGANLFFLPHGLTIDRRNNAYVTDVALHQVLRFNLNLTTAVPDLKLGEEFTPGRMVGRFCKPTSVAVLASGDFFVADGYCNARILQYTAGGQFIRQWGKNTFTGQPLPVTPANYFAIPHALTLYEEPNIKPQLCVADRENGRVQCFDAYSTEFISQYHSPVIGNRIFSVAYAKGNLYVVNGPEIDQTSDIYHEVKGFVINMTTGEVTSKFGPTNINMTSPHDIAVTKDGSEIYIAELENNHLFKFVAGNGTNKPMVPVTNDDESKIKSSFNTALDMKPGATILLVSAIIFTFCIIASGIVLLISKRRRRGCLPTESRGRRHAWDSSNSGQQFKLGSLLDRKRGRFEQLGQDASDEENGGPSSSKGNRSTSQQNLLTEHYT